MNDINEVKRVVTFTIDGKTGQRLSQVFHDPNTGKIDHPFEDAKTIFKQEDTVADKLDIIKMQREVKFTVDAQGRRMSQTFRDPATGKEDHPFEPARVVFFENSQTVKRAEIKQQGKYVSRDGKHGLTVFYESGQICQAAHFVDNFVHADSEPSNLLYNEQGEVEEAWYWPASIKVFHI